MKTKAELKAKTFFLLYEKIKSNIINMTKDKNPEVDLHKNNAITVGMINFQLCFFLK